MQQGGLDDLPELLNLLLAAAHVRVGHVGLLLHLHHGHCGVDLGRQGDVDLVLVAVHPANTGKKHLRREHHREPWLRRSREKADRCCLEDKARAFPAPTSSLASTHGTTRLVALS